jgi:hypothetical protein
VEGKPHIGILTEFCEIRPLLPPFIYFITCRLPTMPPKNKAKAAGISASSFFDLKAELAKQEDDFAKNKAAGKSNAIIVGGVKRPDKVR